MREETLMNKLLDGQEKMIEKLATVSEIVRRHDNETFPEMKKELTKQSDALYRMESKQNEDMVRFVSEKEKVYKELNERLKPLEEEYKNKSENKKETKSKVSSIVWGGVEKITYILIGWILVKINIILKQ